jgi:phospholipid/cholesterol/gamma-HCH transport system permease protein
MPPQDQHPATNHPEPAARARAEALPPGGLRLHLSGRLDAQGLGEVWGQALGLVRGAPGPDLAVEAGEVTALDGAGAALLVRLRQAAEARGGAFEISGLSPDLARLADLFDPAAVAPPPPAPPRPAAHRLAEAVRFSGRWTVGLLSAWKGHIAFTGEMVAALAHGLAHPRRVRWRDVLVAMEKTGVNSLPIIGLIGFLMGLIMSFQSAVTLKRFGGEVFIPNGLGLLCFRELSALITAILLAGRSGSAFAAELGTMKVNEEVDALTTMGLSPVRFLVGPKIMATVAVMPFMCLFFDFFCLVGGAVVMLSLGFPLATYTSRVFASTSFTDFAGGMVKAMVFCILVAGVGCRRGLATGEGASAVGDSTTSAVVLGIILVAVADGVFAVLFFYLGL